MLESVQEAIWLSYREHSTPLRVPTPTLQTPPDREEVVVPHLGQEKNEWVASLEQEEEEVLLEQQKGEEVSLLEQENLVPQRISEGQLQKHSSCSP